MIFDKDLHVATLYFDRSENSINGVVTLKVLHKYTGEIITSIEKLPARSGQNGYTHSSWTTGKSPIPFGDHLLWLDRTKQKGEWATGKGIGEFYPISSDRKDSTKIVNPNNPSLVRNAVGLHPENAYAGSAGCIVLLHETKEQIDKVLKLRGTLISLAESGFKYIKLVVL